MELSLVETLILLLSTTSPSLALAGLTEATCLRPMGATTARLSDEFVLPVRLPWDVAWGKGRAPNYSIYTQEVITSIEATPTCGWLPALPRAALSNINFPPPSELETESGEELELVKVLQWRDVMECATAIG